MRRPAVVAVLAALSFSAAAEWVAVSDNDEYVAYADPATLLRAGNFVEMSDLIDLKSPRASPYGTLHASSKARSRFDCETPRMRTTAFTLHSGQMGNGETVETATMSDAWLTVAPGTLLDALWKFACG
jgi:hypothetical protein